MRHTVQRTAALGGAPRESTFVTDFSASSGKVTCTNLPRISFQGTSQWTFEAWLYLDALVDQMELIGRPSEFVLATRGSRIYAARTNQVAPLLSDPLLESHTWYHVAVSFDGLTMALYVNGVQRNSLTVSDSGVANKGAPMTIGGGFYGQLDSVRLWSALVGPGALYGNQYLDYPSRTSGLEAQIDFAMLEPKDTSGNNVPVTLSKQGVGCRTFVPAGEMQGSFADPYNDSAVNPGGRAQDFSVMACICPSSIGQRGAIFSNGPIAGSAGMSLQLLESGKVQFQVGSSTPVVSSKVLEPNEWQNVACTWQQSSKTGTLYIDGQADGTPAAMTTDGSMTEGEPLIGGGAYDGESLPSLGFWGYIQSASVWSHALSQAQVQQYMTDDPVLDQKCVADYDLLGSLANNNVTLNPVGMVGSASLTVVESLTSTTSPTTPTSTSTSTPEVMPPPRTRSRPLLATHAPRGIAPSNVAPEMLSAAARAAMVKDYRELIGEQLGIVGDQQAQLAAGLEQKLARLYEELLEGTHRIPFEVDIEQWDGVSIMTLRTEDGSTVVYEGLADAACVLWTATLIAQVGMSIFTVYGFTINVNQYVSGLTNLLQQPLQTIGLGRQLVAVFSSGVTPTSIWLALKLLREYKLLGSIVSVAWQGLSASIWTYLALAGRIALLFSPWAPLEAAIFIAELYVATAAIIAQWNKRPAGCWS